MDSGGAAVGSGGSERDDLAIEVARLRVALDELQGRPIPLDADTLRDVITASISDASALQPNLLVTAIRRLDRVDARLESIEATLGRLEVLPTAGPTNGKRGGEESQPGSGSLRPARRRRAVAEAEVIADVLARRMNGPTSAPSLREGRGDSLLEDVVVALSRVEAMVDMRGQRAQ